MDSSPKPPVDADVQSAAGGVDPGKPASTVLDVREYFSNTKHQPHSYMRSLQKQAVRLLSAQESDELAVRVVGDAKSLDRLVGLAVLLPLEKGSDAARRIITDIIVHVIRKVLPQFQVPAHGAPLEDLAVGATSLLRQTRSKRQKHTLTALFALAAVHCGWVGLESVDELISCIAAYASAKPKKKCDRRQKTRADDSQSAKSLLIPFISKPLALSAALKVYAELRSSQASFVRQIAEARVETERVAADLATTAHQLQDQEQYAQTKNEELTQLRGFFEELQKDLVAHAATSRHDMQMLKARLKGVLDGDLSRWLKTAYEASNAVPARTNVVTERLEQVLDAIKREVQWMESSD
jgi:hypothetical protein